MCHKTDRNVSNKMKQTKKLEIKTKEIGKPPR